MTVRGGTACGGAPWPPTDSRRRHVVVELRLPAAFCATNARESAVWRENRGGGPGEQAGHERQHRCPDRRSRFVPGGAAPFSRRRDTAKRQTAISPSRRAARESPKASASSTIRQAASRDDDSVARSNLEQRVARCREGRSLRYFVETARDSAADHHAASSEGGQRGPIGSAFDHSGDRSDTVFDAEAPPFRCSI